jgi:large subunit ribosomal protein L13
MATRIAHVLRGKNKPYYTPHFDCGDYVVVTNSAKIVLTGNKMEDKEYLTFTGYPEARSPRLPRASLAAARTR